MSWWQCTNACYCFRTTVQAWYSTWWCCMSNATRWMTLGQTRSSCRCQTPATSHRPASSTLMTLPRRRLVYAEILHVSYRVNGPLIMQVWVEPIDFKPFNGKHGRFAPIYLKISGKQGTQLPETWHRLRYCNWHFNWSTFSSSKFCSPCCVWLNKFQVSGEMALPPGLQVWSLTCLLVKNGNTRCTRPVNICLQRNMKHITVWCCHIMILIHKIQGVTL